MEWILNIILFFCGLAIAIAFGSAVIIAVSDSPPSWIPLEVDLEVDAPPNTTVHTVDGAEVEVKHGKTMATLALPPELKGPLLLRHIGSLIINAIGVYILLQARAFVRSLRTSHPFIATNAERLRKIAGFTLLGSCLYGVLHFIFPFFVVEHFEDLDLNITLSITLNPVFFALGLYIIAEVFAIGVKMKEQEDLTV